MTDNRDARMRALVSALDDENTNDAEEAQFELTEDFGAEALEPLLAVAPTFSDSGRLCALEVFEAIGDRRAAQVLIPWLRSDNEVIRDWSAGALGQFGADEAIPDLLDTWAASRRRDTPPNWTEPTNIRRALYKLGARKVVLPQTVARLAVKAHPFDLAWSARQLDAVLDGLAAADQVVMFFSFWRRRADLDRDAWYGITEAGATMDLDWTAPWEQLVAMALDEGRKAAAAAAALVLPPGTVVTTEWIDRGDL